MKDETRIKATSEEVREWEVQNTVADGRFFSSVHFLGPGSDVCHLALAPEPNFISNVFYLTIAMSHFGYLKTIQGYNDLAKHIDEMQRHLDFINGDGSWIGVSAFFLIQIHPN